jgi:diamine N-acetyltransferase
MQITKVQMGQLETLRSFAEHTFRIAFEHLNEPARFENYCETSFSTEQLRSEIEHTSSSFWFGWEGEDLAAYLKLNFDQHQQDLHSIRTVKVERLYVEQTFQGQRIGEKMLDFALQQARYAQAEWIWLSVWQATPAALRFYQRCGFEIFGTEIFWLADEAQLDWLVKKRVAS